MCGLTKRFRLRGDGVSMAMRVMREHMHNFNSCKIGKNLRHTMQFSGARINTYQDGAIELVMNFRRGGRMWMRASGRKFLIYKTTDFGKVFRDLKKMSVR
jgi:hypothetical protein